MIVRRYHGSMSPQARDPRAGRNDRSGAPPGEQQSGWPRSIVWVVLGVIGIAIVLSALFSGGKSSDIAYNEFIQKVQAGQVEEIVVQNDSSRITGKTVEGKTFSTTAPVNGLPEGDLKLVRDKVPPGGVKFKSPSTNFLGGLLVWLLPFMSITGSDFMEMFVGVGAARVRDLFQTARKQAPCIIFVDEIDSIGRKRGAGLGGGHDEREQTLNQMLSEMDGFETTEGIVMMAATNRPDILDPALLRPGRFDRQIVVPLPDLEERLPILKVHCRDKKLSPDVDLHLVARGTPGMSGADLANLVNEAALFAVRRGSEVIQAQDFESARDRVMMGQRRESMALSEGEEEIIAEHEGGQAVLAYV